MSSVPSPEEIARDATWLAQALDPAAGMVRLIEMDRDAYRAASFLDDRMLQQLVEAHIVPWPTVASAIGPDARRDARWIFHIGHVGSTLVARLLGELDGVLSVREPRLLRDLAVVAPADRRSLTTAAQALFSRTFGRDETALVKATSFVSEMAPELVPSGGRALFMYISPRNYIASILAGPNSIKELRMRGPDRAQRVARRVTGLPHPKNDAERAATAWACETTALEAAAEAMADREIDWADFDRMLGDVEQALGSAARFFGFAAEPRQLEAIARGPLMKRYSKALEYEYSPGLRRELLAGAESEHRRDIDAALAMLDRAAEHSPLLERALRRAAAEA